MIHWHRLSLGDLRNYFHIPATVLVFRASTLPLCQHSGPSLPGHLHSLWIGPRTRSSGQWNLLNPGIITQPPRSYLSASLHGTWSAWAEAIHALSEVESQHSSVASNTADVQVTPNLGKHDTCITGARLGADLREHFREFEMGAKTREDTLSEMPALCFAFCFCYLCTSFASGRKTLIQLIQFHGGAPSMGATYSGLGLKHFRRISQIKLLPALPPATWIKGLQLEIGSDAQKRRLTPWIARVTPQLRAGRNHKNVIAKPR